MSSSSLNSNIEIMNQRLYSKAVMILNCSPEMGTVLSAIKEEPSISYYIFYCWKFSHRLFTPTPACVRRVWALSNYSNLRLYICWLLLLHFRSPRYLQPFLLCVEIISILFKTANPESAHISIKLLFIGWVEPAEVHKCSLVFIYDSNCSVDIPSY